MERWRIKLSLTLANEADIKAAGQADRFPRLGGAANGAMVIFYSNKHS